MDCSWSGLDVLVVGGFFVEIDSYAIAILCCANSTSGNSMGLILDARGSYFFFHAHSLSESGESLSDHNAHSTSFFIDR